MSGFQLDKVLARDSEFIAKLGLCQLRLMDNKLFPWLLLIPERPNIVEWIDLEREDQHQLSDEIAIISHLFQALVTPDKINIAALGNQVSQFHVHVIGRYRHDSAWPQPVWGAGRDYYQPDEKEKFIYEMKSALQAIG